MGYCIDQTYTNFSIKAGQEEALLAAIHSLVTGKNATNGYSWVNNEEVLNATTVKEAMKAFRWEPCIDMQGWIYNIVFRGEKRGSDDQFFEAIAPLVDSGSEIQMRGEDGYQWKWSFKDKTVKNVSGRFVWDDEVE